MKTRKTYYCVCRGGWDAWRWSWYPAPWSRQSPGMMCPAPWSRQSPGMMSPAPWSRQSPGMMSPAPLSRQSPGMMCPAPLSRQSPGMMCPAPLSRQSPGMMCPAPWSRKSPWRYIFCPQPAVSTVQFFLRWHSVPGIISFSFLYCFKNVEGLLELSLVSSSIFLRWWFGD